MECGLPCGYHFPKFFHVELFPVILQALEAGSESPSSATLLQISSPFSSPNPGNWGASGTTLLVTIIQWLPVTCSHSVITPSHTPQLTIPRHLFSIPSNILDDVNLLSDFYALLSSSDSTLASLSFWIPPALAIHHQVSTLDLAESGQFTKRNKKQLAEFT